MIRFFVRVFLYIHKKILKYSRSRPQRYLAINREGGGGPEEGCSAGPGEPWASVGCVEVGARRGSWVCGLLLLLVLPVLLLLPFLPLFLLFYAGAGNTTAVFRGIEAAKARRKERAAAK